MTRADKAHILAVDDSPMTLEILQRNLESAGYEVVLASSIEEALQYLEYQSFDLVITDIKMPKVSGLELLKYVKENLKHTEIMIITGYPSIRGAVEAVKDGAEDYLVKPFTDEELLSAVSKMLEKLKNRKELSIINFSGRHNIVGISESMQHIYRLIEKAAATKVHVLISGESGTGKELVARAIHYRSKLAAGPFVTVNCTAIPDNLLESELFGHVKGAFTGAQTSKAGFFQIAHQGTLFLDEIGDASINMQGKLLRAIQNKEISMVGSARIQKVDVRIIAATNADLKHLVRKGLFREDLYYRLNVVEMTLPSLQERSDDILPLVRYFLEKIANDLERPTPTISDRALDILKKYRWQGNVRELENLIQRLVVLSDNDSIDVSDLPEHMRYQINWNAPIHRTLAEVEAEHIEAVLNSVKGNKSRAAQLLGIDRKTLREKMKRAVPSSRSG
jgi:DNA-binding NtrC family response regulator